MNMKHATLAALAAAALLFPSCAYYTPATSAYSALSYSSSELWTVASYDSNGFPIYGYYYGRPVYGYTAAGDAIFTLAALTAGCYAPHWAPAPWYHGSWHYPSHIHRVDAPPHFPGMHRPGSRPQGGMNSPINRNPSSVFGPGRPNGPKPGAGAHHPSGPKPGAGAHHPSGPKPGAGAHRPSGPKPGAGAHRPSGPKPGAGAHRPSGPKPGMGGHRPSGRR